MSNLFELGVKVSAEAPSLPMNLCSKLPHVTRALKATSSKNGPARARACPPAKYKNEPRECFLHLSALVWSEGRPSAGAWAGPTGQGTKQTLSLEKLLHRFDLQQEA